MADVAQVDTLTGLLLHWTHPNQVHALGAALIAVLARLPAHDGICKTEVACTWRLMGRSIQEVLREEVVESKHNNPARARTVLHGMALILLVFDSRMLRFAFTPPDATGQHIVTLAALTHSTPPPRDRIQWLLNMTSSPFVSITQTLLYDLNIRQDNPARQQMYMLQLLDDYVYYITQLWVQGVVPDWGWEHRPRLADTQPHMADT